MRTYHVDIAAHASKVERKWIDNLLSHFDIPGVERTRRGSTRRISPTGIYHIALARRIAAGLDTTVKSAVSLAMTLMCAPTMETLLFNGLSFRFDRDAFRAEIDSRINEAVEAIVPAKRGRPPSRHSMAK
jgi:hypothetical protein